MSRGVNPVLVSWLTTMMGLRLQVVLEHMPVGPDAILRYVRRLGILLGKRASWAMGLGDLEPERSERAFRGGLPLCPLTDTSLESQWKFRDQRDLPLSLRYQGEVEEKQRDWRAGQKGWRLRNLKPGSSYCLTPSGKMLPPAPGTTAEEAMSRGPPPAPEGGSRDEQDGASAETEPWAAAVPPVSVRRALLG